MAKKCKCPPPGAPAWMTTFADLMSLLMCFFVLLLAFSEMDVLKFQQLSGSVKYAFGVQHQIEVWDIPKGTSVIAQEFRPGKPDETPLDVINQKTIETTQSSLHFQAGKRDTIGGQQDEGGDSKETVASQAQSSKMDNSDDIEEFVAQMAKNKKRVFIQLKEYIEDGSIEVESKGQELIIRINERGAFAAGSGYLQPRFKPIIRKIAAAIDEIPGEILVTGHTDDAAIRNERYASNWDLSSRRSVAVAQELIKFKGFDETRMTLKARGRNEPLVPNLNSVNRAKNRRVEISVLQGKPIYSDPIEL